MKPTPYLVYELPLWDEQGRFLPESKREVYAAYRALRAHLLGEDA